MTGRRREIGIFGEKAAVRYLSDHGYAIIETNYRCKLGEIDIIAREKETYVFIEVKTRSNASYGRPAEAINFKKQSHLYKAAQMYIQSKRLFHYDFRFDAIEIIGSADRITEINHIKNIF